MIYSLELSEASCPAQADQPLHDHSVADVLRTAAARTPEAAALQEVDGEGALGRLWTYADLRDDSDRLAHALLTRYEPGERIAVWAPNIPEWIIAKFALAMAGLTLVTVNPGYQARELAYVLKQSRAVGLFLIAAHRGNPMASIAADVARDIPAIREIVDLEDHGALFHTAGAPTAWPVVHPHDEAQIQYTSGTTGFPKGVRLHHHGLTNNARHFMAMMKAAPGETMLAIMPLFHTAGCGMTVLGALQFGCRLLLMRQFDGAVAARLVEEQRVDLLMSVPTMLTMILDADAAQPRDFASLRLVAAGGSMVSPELIRRVTARFDCQFSTVYGQTECSPLLTVVRPDSDFDDLCQSIGQPVPQTEIAIRDPATGAAMPCDQVGEICARSYAVMLSYNDDPEATAAAIDSDGWLHTGDLGTMDARGFVRITGRVKDMIIRGGENLFPAEIENILLEHPAVAECAVVGVPDARLGEAVAAYVRTAEGAAFAPADLAAHCRANLAAQKTPAHWIEVQQWPLTGSGKIQKFILRDRFVADNPG